MTNRAMKNRQLLAMTSGLALAAGGASAQTVTDIAPDTQPGFETGTVVTTNGANTRITGGEAAGGNLFHSFAQFDLASGDTATWVRNAADASSILNIVNRVRSVDPSHIDGTLRVADMPNASFWFINPAGVIFGDGASVDVPGAAYFSSAQELGFADGTRFSTVTPDGSTFSSAAPEAFGFLGEQGRIGIRGELTSDTASSVSFVAADVLLDGTVLGDGTRFDFVAVGSETQVAPLPDLGEPAVDGLVQFGPGSQVFAAGATLVGGDVRLSGATVVSNGLADLVVRGNRVGLFEGALLQSDTVAGDAGNVLIEAGLIEISQGSAVRTFAGAGSGLDGGAIALRADGVIVTDGANVRAFTVGAGDAGDITIDAQFVDFSGEEISSISEGSGDSGDIAIASQQFFMQGGALFSETYGSGAGGAVSLTADIVEIVGGAFGTATYGPQGSGTVTIDAGSLVLGGSAFVTSQAIGEGTGSPGLISITADEAQFFGGQITSLGFGGGDAGEVRLDVAGSLSMQGGGRVRSLVIGDGDAGNVSVRAGELFITDNWRISSTTDGNGSTGGVRVETAGNFTIAGNARVETISSGAGDAGLVSVVAGDAAILDEALIRSLVFGSGNSAGVDVDVAGLLYFETFGRVESSTGTDSLGNGGPITIDARELVMQGGQINSNSFGFGNSGSITVNVENATLVDASIAAAGFQDGDAGSISVDVADTLDMGRFSAIEAFNLGNGNGGTVTVRAGELFMDEATINTDIFGDGTGGAVDVEVAGSIRMDGESRIQSAANFVGSAGDVRVVAGDTIHMNSTFSRISAESFGLGDAGSVFVQAPQILIGQDESEILPGGQITSFTAGAGNAGDVTVIADTLRMNLGQINATSFFEATGDAGSVAVEVSGLLEIGESSRIEATSFGAGAGGSVTVIAGDIAMGFNSRIRAPTFGPGDAGSVFVATDTLLIDGGSINSTTVGTGNGGSVTVDAREITMVQGGINSATLSEGDAGTVNVRADVLRVLNGAGISSSTLAEGDAGNVVIEAGLLEIAGGEISSSTEDGTFRIPEGEITGPFFPATGNAGSVQVFADTLSMSDGGQIVASTDNSGAGGDITVEVAGLFDMQGFSTIGAFSEGDGDAGRVRVLAGDLTMGFASINADTGGTGGSGAAGEVDVEVAGTIVMDAGALIASTSLGAGNSGNVSVVAGESIELTSAFARISAEAFGTGNAGSVFVAAPTILMGQDPQAVDPGGQISSITYSRGDAGDVTVLADNLAMNGFSRISAASLADINVAPGTVNVVVTDTLSLDQGAEITSESGRISDAGSVFVSAGTLKLWGGARIAASTGGIGAGGNVAIDVDGDLVIADGASITAETGGDGDAGSVIVSAGRIAMTGGSIDSSTSAGGNAGDVIIGTGTAQLSGDARINSSALRGSSGDAGNVLVEVDGALTLSDAAAITAVTLSSGAAGRIRIDAGSLVMSGGAIASSSDGEGDAGDLEINAGVIRLIGDARVNSAALADSTGNAGTVTITADSLELFADARISASTRGPGDAGQVLLDTGLLVMDGGEVTSFTSGSGDAGLVLIRAGDAFLTNGASINSLTEGGSSGGAGGVGMLVEGLLSLTDNDGEFADGLGVTSEISASTFGSGNAGTVIVEAGDILLRGGLITSATFGPGFAGDVTVTADNISVLFNGSIDSQAEAGSSGGAGDVFVVAADTLRLEPEGNISASSQGTGDAGIVEVRAGVLDMSGGAINSFTADTGNAGLVGVFVGELVMSGGRIDSASDSDAPDAGRAGSVFITADNAFLSGAAEIDSTGSSGDAGDVTVAVLGRLEMADFATISAATVGSGDAGSVEVSAEVLAMTGGEINSVTTGSGDAGAVSILARELMMDGGRITSASEDLEPLPPGDAAGAEAQLAIAAAGDAGDVLVRAGSASLIGGASIDSTSDSSNAGTVTVEVEDLLTLDDFSEISTAARGGGDAGDILIMANTLLLDNFSEISSTADGTFSAGLIAIFADTIRIDNGSAITTNSENGPAGDIGLFLPQDGFLGLSGVDPGVITTSSGANSGGRITIADPFLILSEGGSILALGEQGGANVEISSAFFIRSSDTVNLVSVDGSLLIESNVGEQITGTEVPTVDFLDASGILSGVCAGARELGEVSEFSSRVTGPYSMPASPAPTDLQDSDAQDAASEPIALSMPPTMVPCL